MPPNVLLVVLDTARRDAFEPYGGPPGNAPAIAQLARAGQALDGYSAASWTVPSHAAMLTGTPARALGLGQCPGGRPQGCRPVLETVRDRLLPEVLRRAGGRARAGAPARRRARAAVLLVREPRGVPLPLPAAASLQRPAGARPAA